MNEIKLKGCFTPDTIYATVLKNRGGVVGKDELLSFNGNTGRIANFDKLIEEYESQDIF